MPTISPKTAQEACEALLDADTPEEWISYILSLQTWLIDHEFFKETISDSNHALHFQQLHYCFKILGVGSRNG